MPEQGAVGLGAALVYTFNGMKITKTTRWLCRIRENVYTRKGFKSSHHYSYQAKKKTGRFSKRQMQRALSVSDGLGETKVEFPVVSFREITVATQYFADSKFPIFSGEEGMLEGVTEIAVKRLSKSSGQGLEEFRNEVILIAKLQHRNLVKLLGDYDGKDRSDDKVFYKINSYDKEVAKGLLYLHQDSRLTVVHRDLKASNILLDADMSPKVSDFGMARIFGSAQQQANTNQLVGTYGCMSPEYALEGTFSVKSDIYSFGVLLLEMVSGLKISHPHRLTAFPNLIAFAWSSWKDQNTKDLVDSSISGSCSPDEISRCIHLGLLCVQDDPNSRPLMSWRHGLCSIWRMEPQHFQHQKKPRNHDTDGVAKINSVNRMSLTVLGGRVMEFMVFVHLRGNVIAPAWSLCYDGTKDLINQSTVGSHSFDKYLRWMHRSTEDGSEPGWLSHGSIHLCASEYRLVPGKPLSPGSTIISDDGTFALGFFSPSNPKKHYYVGIWYNNIPKFTVVWVANRAAPITVPSSAVFTLTRSSNLTLYDGNGHVLWTMMAKSRNSISSSGDTKNISTEAVLDNTGNFILRSLVDNAIIWQSFDHPTDTLLPGMNLRLSHKKHPLHRLISWKDKRDPSPGSFSYGAEPNNLLQRFIWHGSVPHRRSPVWNNNLLLGKYMKNLNSTIYMAINHDSDEVYMSFGMPSGPFSVLVRMKITYLGKVNMVGWQSNISAWTTLYSEPAHDCNVYGYCGPNAYCDNTEAVSACKCLDGFEPRDNEGWTKKRSFSRGCRRRKALRCSHGSSFLTYPDMKVPDKFIHIHNRNFDECMVECRSNCSCVAYAYSNISIGIIDVTRCLLWMGELIDMEKVTQGGENLYIRVNRLNDKCCHFDLSLTPSKLMAPTLLSGKQRGDEILGGLMLGDISTSRELSERKVDFPIFTFREIASATNNFSDSNILGHGGFGTVYKGTMEGDKDIAVKRLSKDASRNSALDWTTRFKIIKGVARGILYLHQDSRLTIIHRDLKASNVLLDADMHPKISDFGTAKIFGGNEQQTNTTRVIGTYGYMAPEYALEGTISIKSDVYSFGVLLLEIVSGLKISGVIDPTTGHSNLIAYAWSLWKNGNMSAFVDASISESSSLDEALRCIHIALLSIQNNPNARPLMSWVVSSLDNKDIELPEPKEPMYAQRSYGADGAGESFVNDISIATLEAR
uniref:non-specific serine/threonine protein kinase n=1 Tax=Oryza punctata TaxID=4537 RepID=A0A0E0LRW8_ORYPU